ncbi:MAG: hypothetical protein ABIK09_05900 [Pseudomonadota bacterium]
MFGKKKVEPRVMFRAAVEGKLGELSRLEFETRKKEQEIRAIIDSLGRKRTALTKSLRSLSAAEQGGAAGERIGLEGKRLKSELGSQDRSLKEVSVLTSAYNHALASLRTTLNRIDYTPNPEVYDAFPVELWVSQLAKANPAEMRDMVTRLNDDLREAIEETVGALDDSNEEAEVLTNEHEQAVQEGFDFLLEDDEEDAMEMNREAPERKFEFD